jgi:hypothetical protein
VVTRVAQQHKDGCGRAVLAMLTGTTYEAVDQLIPARDGKRDLELWQQERFLMERGWFQRVVLKREEADGVWPPRPFAPLHMAMVSSRGGPGHSVVMLSDGTVLDPNNPGGWRLTDWPIVYVVVGLVPPALVPAGPS